MSTVTLPQREVRVLDNVDVCVIGGGPGGGACRPRGGAPGG